MDPNCEKHLNQLAIACRALDTMRKAVRFSKNRGVKVSADDLKGDSNAWRYLTPEQVADATSMCEGIVKGLNAEQLDLIEAFTLDV